MTKKAAVSFMFMSRVKEDKLLTFSRNVQKRVGTNPLFAKIASLANDDLKPANDAFSDDLENTLGGGTENTSKKNKSEAKVLEVLERIGMEVDILATGDESVILAAGFLTRKRGEHSTEDPDPVSDLLVSTTLKEGEVLCKWTKPARSNKIALEWAPDDQTVWNNGYYSDGIKLLMKGLPSKQWIWIRARALGSGNRKSAWCDPVRVFVL